MKNTNLIRLSMRCLSRSMILYLTIVSLVACDKGEQEQIVTNLVIREMPPGSDVAVAYLNVINSGETVLAINQISSPSVETIEIHQHLHIDGQMQMREVKHFTVPPRARVNFTPGGYHLMLIGVETRFEEGDKVPLTFDIKGEPSFTLEADVRKL